MNSAAAVIDAWVPWIAPIGALVALLAAAWFHRGMLASDPSTPRMREIAAHVREGAMAYLAQQYRVMTLIVVALAGLAGLLAWAFQLVHPWLAPALLAGALASAFAGWVGMHTATLASSRTAAAARTSLSAALQVAFRSGAVMGLTVVGLGLGLVSAAMVIGAAALPADLADGMQGLGLATGLLGLSVGASLQALFARVGGGIFTKAADVGADLVGKVESGIPEDDARNPAVIADNVGDNVGDVAGMGADLFESYCGSMLAACALGAAAFAADPVLQTRAMTAPLALAGLGALVSVGGVLLVRGGEEGSPAALLRVLGRGVLASALALLLAAAWLLPAMGLPNAWGLWSAVLAGVLTGLVLGQATERATSAGYAPTRRIAAAAEGGPATTIIAGLGGGMVSTAVPVLAVCVGTLAAFASASGLDATRLELGLYGIALAAVGMLSTLGITLACDAYGPIADNAGGNAEMAGLGPEVRARTDALDALGNTTAATGKGFAIGSAALTALALIATYLEVLRVELLRAGVAALDLPGGSVATMQASLGDLADHFGLGVLNPAVVVGLMTGAMVAFVFSGLTVQAVGRAAGQMVDEVRRQFREQPGILAGEAEPDYARCVEIATRGAQREMLVPGALGVLAPLLVALLLGVAGVVGLLLGGLAAGFSLAMFMSNAGGAWDNAKKYIESGQHGGKNSRAHRAAVIGDTIGDPFKDTSGPSLNILIKLMSIVAIAGAGLALHGLGG